MSLAGRHSSLGVSQASGLGFLSVHPFLVHNLEAPPKHAETPPPVYVGM